MSLKLTMKVEKWADRFIQTEKKDKSSQGRKKGYAMRVRYQDGVEVNYTMIKGFEYVRRDSSQLCKWSQKAVLDLMLNGKINEKEQKKLQVTEEQAKDVITLIRAVRENYKGKKYTIEEMAIPKRPGKKFQDYHPKPAFVRGAIYFNDNIAKDERISPIDDGDPVKHIYVKRIAGFPVTDIISYTEVGTLPEMEVDYDTMFEKQVWGKVEKLLELMGLNWSHVLGQTTVGEFL